jgi:hypothetical protein
MCKPTFAAWLCVLGLAGTASADPSVQQVVDTARKTMASYEKAVIRVSGVGKIDAQGSAAMASTLSRLTGKEQKMEGTVTVIDPSGLAVGSGDSLGAGTKRFSFNVAGQRQTIELRIKMSGLKYRLANGTEVPAVVVLKDPDLDLVFLAPEKPLDAAAQKAIAFVPLDAAAPAPSLLDWVIHIEREGKDSGYAASLELGQIRTLVQKPRPCYAASVVGSGTPVFDGRGKLLGFMVNCKGRVSGGEDEGTGSSGSSTTSSRGASAAILPLAEVRKVTQQAKEKMKQAKEKAEAKAKEKEKKKPAPPAKQ